MTLCELLNQKLPIETKRLTTLTGLFYWAQTYCRNGNWQSVREAKRLLEDITDMPYYPTRYSKRG